MIRRTAVAAAVALAALLATAGPARAGGPPAYVVALDAGTSEADADAIAADVGADPDLHFHGRAAGMAVRLSPGQADRLAAEPGVDFVERDEEVTGAGELVPPGVRRVGGTTAAGAARAASGADVAVVDTGIAATTELNVGAGVNCVSAGTAPTDDNGHGTNVAGIVGARANGAATVGVAPGTRVHPVKVLNARMGGTLSQLLCGLDWISANAAAQGIRVVNLSLAASGKDDGACGSVNGDALHRAVCSLTKAGILVVAAAGNAKTGFESTAPAAYREVLTVTSMADTDGLPGVRGAAPSCVKGESDDRYAATSNWAVTAGSQAHVIAAPGVCVTSTGSTSATSTYVGTSQAAPHASAAAALCLDDAGAPGPCAGLTPAEMIARLRADGLSGASGFLGDPLKPVTGRAYGPLVTAAAY